MSIDIEKLKKIAEIFSKIGHSTRLSILQLLSLKGPQNVGQIRDALQIEQSQTTRHLNKLSDCRVVKRERKGKFVFYSIDFNRFEELVNCLSCITNV